MNSKTIRYFGLTFVISWLLWLPSVLRSTVMPELPEFVGLFGMFAPLVPMLVAFYLVSRESGWAGLKTFMARAIRLDFNKLWLIPTIVIFPIVGIVTIAILNQLGETLEWSTLSPIAAISTFFMILFVGGGLEEFGWRGYALDPLQDRYGMLTASLVLGFIWGLWHLPLFFIEGTVQSNIPAWQFILQTMVIAILYTWLYNHTNGSLFVAILFHTIGNTTSALLPAYFATSTGRWANFLILLVLVIVILLIERSRNANTSLSARRS